MNGWCIIALKILRGLHRARGRGVCGQVMLAGTVWIVYRIAGLVGTSK